jgi:hypothetical protein
MVGGTDIQEFEEANFEALVENFIENHEIEFNSWLSESGYYYDQGQPSEEHDEFFGGVGWSKDGIALETGELDDFKTEFATKHDEWSRFVEIEYATRGGRCDPDNHEEE